MKIFISILLMMFFTYNQVFAIAPLNEQSITAAQKYGIDNSKINLGLFLKPWLSYEETSSKLDETAETAHIYTSYLLIATDAKEATLKNKKVTLQDSEKVIIDYNDILSFSIKVSGENDIFAQNLVAIIVQGDNVVKSVKIIPQAVSYNEKNKKYSAGSFVYFKESSIELGKPIKLIISTSDNNKHCFYFDLAKIN
ncbi:MAG: hypothetical protein KBI38_02470 [Negativicutes bacterium]|nr:hypothetical protein [Negativicutes bacterium]MBP8628927.1 hypothetical protein [Negativicutes bacterium]MBP9536837.1 hypothetical protein [Negativicutes bacterium]MBP9948584.1 hypothetical protein [Negativicutes bacterium]